MTKDTFWVITCQLRKKLESHFKYSFDTFYENNDRNGIDII